MAQTHEPTPRKPLRLWPGVAALALWLAWLVVRLRRSKSERHGSACRPRLRAGGHPLVAVLQPGPVGRAARRICLDGRWSRRHSRLVHASIANGMMGFMLPVYSFPVLCLALVVWAVVSRGMATGRRRVALVGAILLACATMTLIRTNGITGDAGSDLEWRWTPTPEERLLAQGSDEPLPPKPLPPPAANEPAARPSTSTAPATPEKPLQPQAGEEPSTLLGQASGTAVGCGHSRDRSRLARFSRTRP